MSGMGGRSGVGTGPGAAEAVLRLAGVSKTYARVVGESLARGRRQVLADVGLTIRPGEIYGFVGLNGAGKTTSIKIALGLTHPDAGTVEVFGEPWSPRACGRVGYAPEKPAFSDFLTGAEILQFAARLLGVSPSDQRYREVLERVGLWDDRGKQVAHYSKGMQQRLALAAAMLHDPELYVLDEPSSGLDPLGRRLVKEILRDLRRAGRTIFFSTHILADVREICDRIGVIHQGRMIFEGTLEEFNPGGGDLEERFVSLIGGPEALAGSTLGTED